MRPVLLHAFPLNARQWADQLAAFPDSVAPDLNDLGATMTTLAHRVLATTPGPLVVLGNSMGGSCALEMARIAPDRIRALVLVGSKAAVRYEPELRDSYIDTLRTQGVEGMWPMFEPHLPERAKQLSHEQSVDQLVNAVRVFHTRPDAAKVLADFDGPVHMVQGELDSVGSVERAQAMADSAKNGRLHVAPNAGHFVNLDQPEWFNALFVEVLSNATE